VSAPVIGVCRTASEVISVAGGHASGAVRRRRARRPSARGPGNSRIAAVSCLAHHSVGAWKPEQKDGGVDAAPGLARRHASEWQPKAPADSADTDVAGARQRVAEAGEGGMRSRGVELFQSDVARGVTHRSRGDATKLS
jgi:hypothetical protein